VSGYTKLFSSIIGSTIWKADNEIRIVWVTLLALADRHGCVESSIPGLADFAHVSLPDCERALEALGSPDPYSRSKDLDGRRIMPIDGGWQLVNHAKYRAAVSADDRREYLRKKQREYRLKVHVNTQSTNVNNVSDKSTKYTQAAPAQAPDPSPPRSKPRAVRSAPAASGTAFEDFWRAYPRKTAKAKARKAWADLTSAPDRSVILKALEWQCRQPDWRKEDGKFIPYPASWLNGRRWEDEPYEAPIEPASCDPVADLVAKAGVPRYQQQRYFTGCDIEWRDGHQVLIVRRESYPGEIAKLFGQQLRDAGVDFLVSP
jgi:hypothetical protein